MAGRAIDLTGKKALVTGGSRGIGEAVVRLLAQHGAQVAVHFATAGGRAAEVAASLPGTGHATLGCDLADSQRRPDFRSGRPRRSGGWTSWSTTPGSTNPTTPSKGTRGVGPRSGTGPSR